MGVRIGTVSGESTWEGPTYYNPDRVIILINLYMLTEIMFSLMRKNYFPK